MRNININKWSYILVLIALTLLSLYVGFYISTATAFPQNPSTQAYFDKICNMPHINTPGPQSPEVFWQQGGNCDDRALVLKTYLEIKGAKGVQICWVSRMENGTMVPCYNGAMGHSFVVWNNRVYNPTLNESHRFYDADIPEFKQFLSETYGFNTWYFENQTVGIQF
ncbi:hypothetical protein [Methanobacterium sp.]|uniref:hypothetical protein n=1 Tax=Methanobacterium sp. TaxID=2164 RepID=UPI0025F7D440|nr:hypothetical protein [Methanobacterium sp.]MBI5460444.1 hypothetical protein [Methanobacterium sp.]